MSTKPPLTGLREFARRLIAAPGKGLALLLRTALGNRPGAYWMIPLWIALGMAVVSLFTTTYLSYSVPLNSVSQPLIVALSLAIVAAGLRRIAERSGSLRSRRTMALLILSIAAAVGVYLLAMHLSDASGLLGVQVPGEVSSAVWSAYGVLSFLVVLALVIGSRWTLPTSWRALAIGLIGGEILSITLAYPVITWTYNNFVPGGLTDVTWTLNRFVPSGMATGPAHDQANLISVTIAILLGLSIGPLTVIWTRPSTTQRRVAFGGIAGALVGLILFINLGGPTAGIIASAPLYGVALTRVGFNTGEWLLKLAQTVNMTFLITTAVYWLCVLTITGVSGITALLTPVKSEPADAETGKRAAPFLPIISMFATVPLLLLTGATIAILALLGPSIANIFGEFGYSVGLQQPESTTLLPAYQSWLALVLLQAISLYWLNREQAHPYRRALSIVACLSGAINILWLLFSLSLGHSADILVVLGLVSGVLGLETLLAGLRLYRQSLDDKPGQIGRAAWVNACVWSGFLAAALLAQAVAGMLNLVMIPVVLIVDLATTKAPPIGLPSLREKLAPLYSVSASPVFPYLVVMSIVSLLVATWVSRGWQRKLHWLWRVVWGIVRTVYRRGAPVGVPAWRRWVTWIGVGIVVDFLFIHTPVLTVVALMAVVGDLTIERLPMPVIALAYVITLAGLLAFWLGKSTDSMFGLATLLFGPGFLVYRALMAYTPEALRSRVRLTALMGVVLIGGLFGYLNQVSLSVQGGVSRYDGQRWQVYDPSNSAIGVQLSYRFFQDSQGNLWFSGNKGVAVKHEAEQWTTYLIYGSSVNIEPDFSWITRNMLLADAGPGKLWTSLGGSFSQFDVTSDSTLSFSAPEWIVPRRHLTPAEVASPQRDALGKAMLCDQVDIAQWSVPLPSGAPAEGEPTPEFTTNPRTGAVEKDYPCSLSITGVTAMARDTNGKLWLATARNGAISLDTNRALNDADWQTYSAEKGQLASDTINALYIDTTGVVWFATDQGLTRFDGATLKSLTVPNMGDQNVTTVFVDSKGGVWAGTSTGAQRFDGTAWKLIVKNTPVTVFAEGNDGTIWVGAPTGLIRYDPQSGAQDVFNAHNSGMAADNVRDLYVDNKGGLWVSTFAAEQSSHSPLPGVLLSMTFFGGLFVFNYREYQTAPETQARRLVRQIAAAPGSLYPQAYALLEGGPSGAAILDRLPRYLAESGDVTGASGITALLGLARLTPDGNAEAALESAVDAFGADSRREWADSLHELSRLKAASVKVERVSDLTNLELAVNPGQTGGGVALTARGYAIDNAPVFLPAGAAHAWRALEKVGVTLRKYQAVDNPSDQLSYLADALASAEAAHSAAQLVGAPEDQTMLAIANHWRAIVTGEINVISGRAELRLELRTRQARRAPEIQLALRLQNTGRSAAENVVVKLADGEGFTPVGETQVRLERLPSGLTEPIEFTVSPAAETTARVVCEVTWTDRAAENRAIEFADIVRFYDVTEEFRRIPNPYIVGHPVKGAEMFFGREDIFRFLVENLGGPIQDRTIVLHGQRRTGKTSILYQLLGGLLGEKFIPVLIDMQELAPLAESTNDFFGEIAYQMGRAVHKAGLTIEAPAVDAFSASPTRTFNRFLDDLEDNLGERRVALMFDEFELIEGKIAEGKLDANILGYFRSLIQHRSHLVFIFTGTHRLQEMSHDYWSILFNIALHRQVSFLSQAEATALIRKPVTGLLDVDDLAVDKIYSLTSGHAYFIQLLCWALVNECNAKARNYATINDVNDAVQEMMSTGEAHFAYIWQTATHEERLALAGLANTIRPGKAWARSTEILETLADNGDSHTQATALVRTLDQLAAQEVLEVAREGALRYRFQLEVLRLWVAANKSIAALVERGK